MKLTDFCKILGIGHPRTGTGYTAKLLQTWGLEVGHEKILNDGIVAWQLLKSKGPYPYLKNIFERPTFSCLIYNLRDPSESLPSIVFTENKHKSSYEFRSQIYPLNGKNSIEDAIESVVKFDELARKLAPSFTYRIEDEDFLLFNYLKSKKKFKIKYKKLDKIVNRRKHKSFDEMIKKFGAPSEEHQTIINVFAQKYGYNKVF